VAGIIFGSALPDRRVPRVILLRLTFDFTLECAARATKAMPQRGQSPGTDDTTSGCIGQTKLCRDCALAQPAGATGKTSKAAIKRIPKIRNVFFSLISIDVDYGL
jgi:hypothetical protein